jgi:branched-chain amino acid transport system substrate-binding protein
MRRTLTRVLLAALVSSALGATALAQPAPISIDVIMPLTGQAAFLGQALGQTVAAFEKYTNAHGGAHGQSIHFSISDDQSNPALAVQLATAIAARHVAVIIGPGVTATCSAVGPIVESNGPVEFCLSPGFTPPANSFAFASTSTIVSSGHAQLIYAKHRGFRRLAVLVSTDATGIVSAQAYAALLKQSDLRGLALVADERINTSDISAAAQMAKIKAARPDVLYTSTSGTLFATVMHAMSDSGLNVPVLTTGANGNLVQLKALNDMLPRELYYSGFSSRLGDLLRDNGIRAQVTAFDEAFKMIGAAPTDSSALAWDELQLTLAGFRQFGPTMTAEQLKAFVLGQRHFAGMNGNYNFATGDQHGLGPDAVVVVGYDKTKGEFYPASQAGGIPLKR